MALKFLTLAPNKFPINKKHDHTAYMIDEQHGKTTKNSGHQHDVEMVEQEPLMIPGPPLTQMGMDGMMMQIPQMQMKPQPPKLAVMPGPDGHTHELIPFEIPEEEKTKSKEEEDKEIIEEVFQLRRQAQDFDLTSRTKAIDDEKYLTDDQWKAEAKAEMTATDRPAITVNTIVPKLEVLSGYQRANRTDFKFYPVEEGDQIGGDISNELAKITCERINYHQEESRTFWQQSTVGRGFLYGSIDYEMDDKGFPKIKFVDWLKVNTGPHFEIDGSDMEFFTIDEIFSKEKVVAMYPHLKEKIEEMMHNASNPTNTLSTRADVDDPSVSYLVWDKSVINKLNKTITIVELQKYEYEPKYIFVDVNNPDNTANITGMPNSIMEDLKTIEGVKIMTASKRKVRMIKVAGDILLEDECPKWKDGSDINEFSLWPVYATKSRDQWSGKVRNCKSLADLNNKYMSSSADILNKMNNYIWYIKENMFKDPKEMQKFIRNASKPGHISILNDDATDKPSREQGVKYPAELENAMRLTLQIMDIMMNVNAELMGGKTNAQSGYQEDQRRKAAVLGNEFLFDNLSMTKRRIGKWLLMVFQNVFGKERIARMLNNYDQRQPMKIGGERFDKAKIEQYLENVDFTKYDILISETSMNVSRRMANLEQLLKMSSTAPGTIPPQLIFKYMDLTDEDRKEAMELIQQQMQQAMQQKQQDQNSEQQKTQTAGEYKLQLEKMKQEAKLNEGGM